MLETSTTSVKNDIVNGTSKRNELHVNSLAEKLYQFLAPPSAVTSSRAKSTNKLPQTVTVEAIDDNSTSTTACTPKLTPYKHKINDQCRNSTNILSSVCNTYNIRLS